MQYWATACWRPTGERCAHWTMALWKQRWERLSPTGWKVAILSAGRGVAMLAAQQGGIPLYEYTPMQIKLAVTGNGHADKKQVQQMVKLLLNLKTVPKPDDAADALGAAICHANTSEVSRAEFRIK